MEDELAELADQFGARRLVTIVVDDDEDLVEVDADPGMSRFEVYGLLLAAVEHWRTMHITPVQWSELTEWTEAEWTEPTEGDE